MLVQGISEKSQKIQILDLEKFQNLCTFYVSQKMNLLPQVFLWDGCNWFTEYGR